MKRVARVMLEVDDAKLNEWADGSKSERDASIAGVKSEAVCYLNHNISRYEKLSFIEWENFCPKCEDTDLKQLNVDFTGELMIVDYECLECGNKFTTEDCQI